MIGVNLRYGPSFWEWIIMWNMVTIMIYKNEFKIVLYLVGSKTVPLYYSVRMYIEISFLYLFKTLKTFINSENYWLNLY
jgi:hypothetical protein